MNVLQGYRTIIFNVLMGVTGIVATKIGLDVDHQTQTEIVTGVLAIGNIALRFLTNTPVGTKN